MKGFQGLKEPPKAVFRLYGMTSMIIASLFTKKAPIMVMATLVILPMIAILVPPITSSYHLTAITNIAPDDVAEGTFENLLGKKITDAGESTEDYLLGNTVFAGGSPIEDPELYFPNFLFYSKQVANALVDYLYDNVSGGFYRSTSEQWQAQDIDKAKYTYDQAQAIMAFLKIAEAVYNDTERDWAIQIANQTANYMITDLMEPAFDGFTTSTSEGVYRRAGIQGKAIQALVELYRVTGNDTWLNNAESCLAFMNEYGWDSEGRGYYYILNHIGSIASKNPIANDPYSPSAKKVDHNVIMGKALLDLYEITNDSAHLSRAIEIYRFLNSTCRDNELTDLFFTGVDSENYVVERSTIDVFVNCQVLEFLSELFGATNDSAYRDDFQSLLYAVLLSPGFWDNQNAGVYATFSRDVFIGRDTKKYTERQFYLLRALDEAFRITGDDGYYNIILDVMEFLNDHLYDSYHEGYISVTTEEGIIAETSWRDKFTVIQALAIYELANLWLYSKPAVNNAVWSPTNPRPTDDVTVTAAAFDADGLASVVCNYSIDRDPYELAPMDTHPQVGNLFTIPFAGRSNGTTVAFSIIVNDTLGNSFVRGVYNFIFLYDIWSPYLEEVLIEPNERVMDVNTEVKTYVYIEDVPSQGRILTAGIYYHREDETELYQRLVPMTEGGYWTFEFPEKLDEPETIVYYYEAIDDSGNIGYSPDYTIQIKGEKSVLPILPVVFGAFVVVLVIPAGLYLYVDQKKKGAKKKLKSIRLQKKLKGRKRGTRRS
ncbi:MAG: AGE family epimerase/isomerase [Candidatus Hodarchaeales archaeon]|jgi:mannose/cellobiose epimerase-like protein (N-acyl-D-glucosamine 2-epimerase family)